MNTALKHNQDIYYKLIEADNAEVDKKIWDDVDRTIMLTENGTKFIEDKRQKLFNVLKAYSVYDSEVGYCQGTNYIVAVLLSCIKSERACFWTFFQLMNEKHWRDMFIPGLPKLMRILDTLVLSIKNRLEDLYEYFLKTNVNFFTLVS
jgi:hypothetical protein